MTKIAAADRSRQPSLWCFRKKTPLKVRNFLTRSCFIGLFVRTYFGMGPTLPAHYVRTQTEVKEEEFFLFQWYA